MAAALARALDAKDPETAQHSMRVGRLAEAVARAMGLHRSFQRTLRLAGELHDVGKIGVPDDLLRRPGRLSAEEHREVLRHTVIGERILSPMLPAGSVVLQTVRSHHERFDGTGFPDGLRGVDIPLAARIVAVVDAFDAMTSARPYRRSVGRAAALRELRRSAGSQFDPACVGALLRVLQSSRDAGRRSAAGRDDRRARPRMLSLIRGSAGLPGRPRAGAAGPLAGAPQPLAQPP
jgi:HD-GYP domain-containing protein (c-di-GMP phosphodiesterase class II)